jgi:hypothetical protein
MVGEVYLKSKKCPMAWAFLLFEVLVLGCLSYGKPYHATHNGSRNDINKSFG